MQLAKDAVRFTMLTRKADAQMDFDIAKVIEASRENPVFHVQYAHARIICSTLRKALDEEGCTDRSKWWWPSLGKECDGHPPSTPNCHEPNSLLLAIVNSLHERNYALVVVYKTESRLDGKRPETWHWHTILGLQGS